MTSSTILLHTCCGPCSEGVVPLLEETGIHPVLYWNNPNIHPAAEYLSRLGGLREFAVLHALPLIIDGTYGLKEYLEEVKDDYDGRCAICYRIRLGAAARYAAQNGFDAFSTTLLVSPYQDHDKLRETGEKCAKEAGIFFYYQDFRPGFRAGQDKAREDGLYMQKYCGCIFSEQDRYQKKLDKQPCGFFPNISMK